MDVFETGLLPKFNSSPDSGDLIDKDVHVSLSCYETQQNDPGHIYENETHMMILLLFLKINMMMKMMNLVDLKSILGELVPNSCIKWVLMIKL